MSAEVSAEGAGLFSGLPEAAEPATARSKVAEADTIAAPLALLWWKLVLPWVPIPPALPQSPGPPPAARTWGLIYKACVRSDLILECAYA